MARARAPPEYEYGVFDSKFSKNGPNGLIETSMRLLILNYEYPPLGGGAGRATEELLSQLAQKPQLKIDVVTSSIGQTCVTRYSQNTTIYFVDINKSGMLHYQYNSDLLMYAWKSYWQCRRLVKLSSYDLVHAFFGIPCGVIAMKLGLPYIVSLRGSDVPFYNVRFKMLDKLIFRRVSRKVWRNAEAVVALSHDLRKLAQQTSPSQKFEVVYNGVDTGTFVPAAQSLDEKPVKLLFVGRLIERKGLRYLLEAFVSLAAKYPDLTLEVAGDGPLYAQHVGFARSNGIGDRVFFRGNVPHDKLPALYQSSKIFLLPSLNEALGNVTFEALAAGLPIVTTDTGAAEMVDENGLVVPKRSSAALQTAIEELLTDGNRLRTMAARSREIALGLTWEKSAASYLSIYEKALSSTVESAD